MLLWAPPLLVGAGYACAAYGWLLAGLRPDDAAYMAFGVLMQALPYQELAETDAHWALHLGRWLAATGVFWAGVAAVWRLLREDITRLRAHAGAFQAVVIGQGAIAQAAFDKGAGKQRLLWLGAERLEPRLSRIGLPEVEEARRLRRIRSHADHARHVLIAGLPPPDAILAAKAAREASGAARICVLLADAGAAGQARALLDDAGIEVESEAALAARAFHCDHPPFLSLHASAAGRVRLLLVGFGATGQAIARDLIINGRTTQLDLPEIVVIDPEAGPKLAAWRARAPELDETARFTAINGRICPESPPPPLGEALVGGLSRVCLCLDSDAASLASLSALAPLLKGAAVEAVFVRLRAKGLSGAGFTGFGATETVLAESGFLGDDADRAARTYHEAWLKAQAANPAADRANPAAVAWSKLAWTYRDASRAAAAHIPAKLASAGVDPALWRGQRGLPRLPAGARLFTTDAELEALAALEHERWNAERRLDGWAYADLPRKDEAGKRHPSLQPFSALSEDVKAYDRALVRETERLLSLGEPGKLGAVG